MTLAISVTQAGPGPVRGLAPAASHLRRPRPVGAARATARTADTLEERAASGIPLSYPLGSGRRNVPLAEQALSTRFQKYDNGTWSPSPTASRSPLSQKVRAVIGWDTTKLWKEIAISLWERGDREAVSEGELIRYRTFETVNLGKDPGQNGKNGGTNPSNSCIIINMIQKTNLEQT